MEKTIELLQTDFNGLLFTNLVDFDALWGHRRDPIGYGKEIENFDDQLRVLLKSLKEDDLLILTADHGNDPIFAGTDHTREDIPLILYSPKHVGAGLLPSNTFASIGKTIADNFGVKLPEYGYSYLEDLK